MIKVLLESVSMVQKNSTPPFVPSLSFPAADAVRAAEEEAKPAQDEKRAEGLSQLAEFALEQGEKAVNVEEPRHVNLNFSIHEASGQIIVSVVDKDTGEVIREIPPEALVDLAAKLQEAVGLLFDKNA